MAPDGAEYSARDLGFLLHKHPEHLHERKTTAGKISIFFSRDRRGADHRRAAS
ncbi:MAG: hypothetical protein AAGD08_17610 [Pseudomonadota bacterium]